MPSSAAFSVRHSFSAFSRSSCRGLRSGLFFCFKNRQRLFRQISAVPDRLQHCLPYRSTSFGENPLMPLKSATEEGFLSAISRTASLPMILNGGRSFFCASSSRNRSTPSSTAIVSRPHLGAPLKRADSGSSLRSVLLTRLRSSHSSSTQESRPFAASSAVSSLYRRSAGWCPWQHNRAFPATAVFCSSPPADISCQDRPEALFEDCRKADRRLAEELAGDHGVEEIAYLDAEAAMQHPDIVVGAVKNLDDGRIGKERHQRGEIRTGKRVDDVVFRLGR